MLELAVIDGAYLDAYLGADGGNTVVTQLRSPMFLWRLMYGLDCKSQDIRRNRRLVLDR